MTYTITCSSKSNGNRVIATVDTLDEAIEAAIGAGAVEADARALRHIPRSGACLDVEGHEGDDAHGIWIEID